jgi:hypothetical protein
MGTLSSKWDMAFINSFLGNNDGSRALDHGQKGKQGPYTRKIIVYASNAMNKVSNHDTCPLYRYVYL